MSVNFGFYHRHYYNLIYTDNTALDGPNAFTPVSIPNPCYTGTVVCGGDQPQTLTVYKIDPSLIGKGAPVIDKNSPNNFRVYNGFEGSFMARLRGNTQVFGGFLMARQISRLCDSGDTTATITFAQASDPNYTIFCDQTQFSVPFRTQIKFGGGTADAWTSTGNRQPEYTRQPLSASVESARPAHREEIQLAGRGKPDVADSGGYLQRSECTSDPGRHDQLRIGARPSDAGAAAEDPHIGSTATFLTEEHSAEIVGFPETAFVGDGLKAVPYRMFRFGGADSVRCRFGTGLPLGSPSSRDFLEQPLPGLTGIVGRKLRWKINHLEVFHKLLEDVRHPTGHSFAKRPFNHDHSRFRRTNERQRIGNGIRRHGGVSGLAQQLAKIREHVV
jgi:hypothetical protein